MSLNKSVPEPTVRSSQPQDTSPDYGELVRFLVEPFLDSPEALSVDCEMSNGRSRVWIRVAFEGEDKGRVFGRGGRNIQAIRMVIEASAVAASQSVYLDIYGSNTAAAEREGTYEDKPAPRKAPPRPSSAPRPGSSPPPRRA